MVLDLVDRLARRGERAAQVEQELLEILVRAGVARAGTAVPARVLLTHTTPV
jgi:hypothetical protein